MKISTNIIKSIFLILVLFTGFQSAFAQDDESDAPSNLVRFTPSQLFGKGQYEVTLFNNLYSQTFARDAEGNELSFGVRNSILTSTLQYTVGVSEDSRINLGADVIFSGGSIGASSGSGHFQLFGSETTARDFAVTAIGPRIKVQPFKKFPFYSIQTSFLFPLASDPEGQVDRDVFLALNRYIWRTQFFTDIRLNDKFSLFYEFDVIYNIRRNKEEVFFKPNFVDLPSTLFVNYFPTSKINLYVMGQYSSRWGNTALPEEDPNAQFGQLQWYWQLGAGVKYQLTRKLGFELGYGNFVASRGFRGIEAGGGQVVNFAIRFIN